MGFELGIGEAPNLAKKRLEASVRREGWREKAGPVRCWGENMVSTDHQDRRESELDYVSGNKKVTNEGFLAHEGKDPAYVQPGGSDRR